MPDFDPTAREMLKKMVDIAEMTDDADAGRPDSFKQALRFCFPDDEMDEHLDSYVDQGGAVRLD